MRHRNHMMSWDGLTNVGVIGIFVIFLLLIITVLVILLIIKLSRDSREKQSTSAHEPINEPLSILQRRFAQGEISEEEYIKMKKVLEEK